MLHLRQVRPGDACSRPRPFSKTKAAKEEAEGGPRGAGRRPRECCNKEQIKPVRGGETSYILNDLISISCLMVEKLHVVKGSKNRSNKLATAFADVKVKAEQAQ